MAKLSGFQETGMRLKLLLKKKSKLKIILVENLKLGQKIMVMFMSLI